MSKTSVVYHYTDWCHYCKIMRPVWNRIRNSDLATAIDFSEVDEVATPTRGITSYPTIAMSVPMSGGLPPRIAVYSGEANYERLYGWIRENC